MRPRTFTFALLLVAALALVGGAELLPATKRPNIVLIVLDDWGWRDASYLGNKQIDTPTIDAVAAAGVNFSRAYAAAPNCAPSRACLLTGMLTPRHEVFTVGRSDRGSKAHQKLVPPMSRPELGTNWVTFATVLSQAGYSTGSIGKWHLGADPINGPEAFGFKVNIAGNHLGNPSSYFSPYRFPNLVAEEPGKYLTDHCGDEAVKFLEANKSQPFLLYIPFYSPHTPLQPPADLQAKYRARHTEEEGKVDPKYAAMVESVDRNIARILKKLDELALADDTLVIITSDNGGTDASNNLPLRGKKGMVYEGGLRIPMIFRWPSQLKRGVTCDVPAGLVDLFPTLLAVAGAKPAKQPMDGINLLPFAKGETKHSPRPQFWHFPVYLDGSKPGEFRNTPSSVIRTSDNFKLIRFYEGNRLELYNLATDPTESTNLAGAMPETAARLNTQLQKWLDDTHAPVPTKENSDYNPKPATADDKFNKSKID